MVMEKRIRAADIVRDIREGLSDIELMAKYNLTLKGFLSLLRRSLEAKILDPSEIATRFASYEEILIDDNRTIPRFKVQESIQIQEYKRPDIQGLLTEISENGVRIQGISGSPGDIKILAVSARESLGINPLVFEAECKWSSRESSGTVHAGYETRRVLKGDFSELVSRIAKQHAEEEGSFLESEDPTESLDLASCLIEDVTESGSFSFRGIRKTWFGKLLQVLPIPALLIGEDSHVTFSNKSCERMTNASNGSLIGRQFSSLFINEKTAVEAQETLEKVFSTRKRHSYLGVLEINGSKMWGRISFQSVRMGVDRSVLVLIEDLTYEKEQLIRNQEHQQELRNEIAERKKVEQFLRESEEKYRSLVENAPLGIISVARDGTIIAANPTFLKIIGCVGDKFERACILKLFGDSGARTLFRNCMEQQTVLCEEIPFTGAEGNAFILRILSTPLVDQSGETIGCQAVVEDYTEQKKSQEILLQTARLRAIGEMASGAAHNFNNVLQIVMGNSQMALTHLEWNNLLEIKKNLTNIVESARLGAETVKRLQDFSRTESLETHGRKIFDLSKTAAEAVEMTRTWWQGMAERQGLSITLRTELETSCPILGMQNEIFEVVVNLIKNAVEALAGPGRIVVRSEVRDRSVSLQVQDNGIGIPNENLGHIFAPFWTTKGTQGTGMGLSSSYGIVRRHGGEISVQSRQGEGSIFTVVLPLVSRREPIPQVGLKEQLDFRLNILVVDDIEQIVNSLHEALTIRNQTVFCALSGSQALEVFEHHQIDLVICDLGMPEMNGWQIAERIEALSTTRGVSRPSFILLTGWGSEVSAFDPRKHPVDHVLEKPVDLNELLNVISGFVTKKQA